MSGEPIMPVRKTATRYAVCESPVIFAADCDLGEGDIPVVVAPIDAASWHAMVERGAQKHHARWMPDYAHAWDSEREDMKDQCRYEAAETLRAALNLPDGWTP